MIGTAFGVRVVAHVRSELVAVHARHLDIEQDDVGYVFLKHANRLDAVLRSEHAEVVAVQKRCVTRRMVIESSTTRAVGRSGVGSTGGATGSSTGLWLRTSAPASRITTTRPSPSIVAPEIPRMLDS